MKKITAILSLLLCLLLTVSLVGCGGSEDNNPTAEPTSAPTEAPTDEPTAEPTAEPTDVPTEAPTDEPTAAPTEVPTNTDPADPGDLPVADIVNFSFDENGIVESSGNKYDIEIFGEPKTVLNEKFGRYEFAAEGGKFGQSNGNSFAIVGFDEFYDKMCESFTWEVYCMYNEMYQEMYPIGNLHAGGVAIGCPDGLDQFCALIRSEGTYEQPIFCDSEAGVYYHLVLTFDGSKATLYTNGEKCDEVAIDEFMFTDNSGAMYLSVGADTEPTHEGEYFWDGNIVFGKVYSKCLTAEQVAALYAAIAK